MNYNSASAPPVIPNSQLWEQLESEEHNNQDLILQLLELSKKILEKE